MAAPASNRVPLGILGVVQRREANQIVDGEGGAHGW